jgi:hypothetical protein
MYGSGYLVGSLSVQSQIVGTFVKLPQDIKDIIKILFIHQLIHKQIVLKNNIKIYIKTAPTCFGAVTPSSGSALLMLTKVTVVKIVH